MATIVPQECVGVYMQAMITSSDVRVTSSDVQVTSSDVRVTSSDVQVRICISVPYGRRTERGLKYLLVEDTGSGSFPLPSDYFLVFTP